VQPAISNKALGTESERCKCSIIGRGNAACAETTRWQPHQWASNRPWDLSITFRTQCRQQDDEIWQFRPKQLYQGLFRDDDDDDDILVEYKIKTSLSKPLRHIRGGRAEFKVKLLSLLTSAKDGGFSFTLRLLYLQGKRQNSMNRQLL